VKEKTVMKRTRDGDNLTHMLSGSSSPEMTKMKLLNSPKKDILIFGSNDSEKASIAFSWCSPILSVLSEQQELCPMTMNIIQISVNQNMRAILFDWLIEIGEEYNGGISTLFLCFSLVDRMLVHQSIPKSKLQMLGITCYFIASKLFDTAPIRCGDVVYICDNIYTELQVLEMEEMILKKLDFNVIRPTPGTFLQLIKGETESKSSGTFKQWHLAAFILEMVALKYDSLSHTPLQLVETAMSLAGKMIYRHEERESTTNPILLPLERRVNDWVEEMKRNDNFRACMQKYRRMKFNRVAEINTL